ncbi:putative ribonuclease H protein [Vitis vinifera]|uniref:Putative ribonuclease H protein n=1 Tax=Vitis vinifera TaxID=29760 RepID=A0A438ISZ0_VITVI|nr:putative ribonuclease H protein [Vitis vinifera]
MEVFSSMMRRAISGGYLFGWKVSGGRGEGMHISHLLFADDTLVFCEESSNEMTYLSWLLMWFEACSGLRINLEKSEMIPVGRVLNIEGLALELGCKVGGIPSSYLGMPLGQLSTLWRCGMGLKSGFVEGLLCGRGMRLRLEKIQRDFLWGGGTLAHKPHLVRWNLVCLEKRKGGLGVRNLSLMNNALLCKWNWRFANERDALWRSVISLKYGVEEGGWCTRDVMGRNGVGLWKAIRKKWGCLMAG